MYKPQPAKSALNKLQYYFSSLKSKKYGNLVIYAISFGIIGTVILIFSSAASTTNFIEPESGAISGNASVVSDATASNGSYVLFQACPAGQTGTPPNCVVPANAVAIQVGDDAQAIVSSNPTGTVFNVKAGVHQNWIVQPKTDDKFYGEVGAILDGTNSTRWAFFAYLNDSDIPPANVLISGLEIRNYTANGIPQTGAINPHKDTRPEAGMAQNWTVDKCNVHDNWYSGVDVADGMTVSNSHIHNNGAVGIFGTGANITITDNEIDNNATRYAGWPNFNDQDVGGVKLVGVDPTARVRGVSFTKNNVHNNSGIGLWFDIDAENLNIDSNTIANNGASGVAMEESGPATISNNIVTGNGSNKGWAWHAGIELPASHDITVTGNTVSANSNGIMIIQQTRGSVGEPGLSGIPQIAKNITVTGNHVTNSGGVGAVEDTTLAPWGGLYDSSRNITFESNVYIGVSGNFWWNDANNLSFGSWQAVGKDLHGTSN